MPRDNVTIRADKLLADGKVRPYRCTADGIAAMVLGNGGIYHALLWREGGITRRRCDCTNGAMYPDRATCAHTEALTRLWPPLPRERT